jgi:NADH-quinone oxidoreductase subunit J
MTGVGIAIGFWVLAAVAVASALAVVLWRNILRAALILVLCFVSVAGIYITLSADFLAAVQVLIYAGAIATLLVFAVMLTRDAPRGNLLNRFWFPALVISVLMLMVIIYTSLSTPWNTVAEVASEPTTSAIATALFDKEKGFVLPFEIASALLLAATIGAIALAKEK